MKKKKIKENVKKIEQKNVGQKKFREKKLVTFSWHTDRHTEPSYYI